MEKLEINKLIFRQVIKQYGLIEIENNSYMLLDCNIIFKFNENNDYVCVRGVIPIELAVEMYETYKNKEPKEFSNCISHSLKNPLEIANHPSIDINNILSISNQTGEDINIVFEKLRKKLLLEDYENCYIDNAYIYTPEALVWYIETTQAYHENKNKIKLRK